MKISTFRARDMREALQAVKEALGADAVILSTRRVREKGKGGLPVGPALIEVTACPNPVSGGTRREEGYGEAPARRAPAGEYRSREEAPPMDYRDRDERPAPDYRDRDERPAPDYRGRDERPASDYRGRDERPAPDYRGRDERPAPDYRGRDERPAPDYRGRDERPAPDFRGRDERPPSDFRPRDERPSLGDRDDWSAQEYRQERPAPEPVTRGEERRGGFSALVDDDIVPMRDEPARPAPSQRPREREAPLTAAPAPEGDRLVDDLSTIRNTLAHLEERVSSLPSVVVQEMKRLPEVPGLDADGQRIYGYLLMQGVEEPIARQLAMVERAAKDGRGMEMALRRFLLFRDPLQGEGSRVVALVGPTGVGKTTTLAKMAAELILNRRRNVGMITLDTFRVGAVAQLETYAKLLQVRLVVARSPSEVKAGLHSLGRCDFILVDTVGSSPYNQRQVNATAELLPSMGDDREVLLCMAGNVRETEQRAIFKRFSALHPTGLVFTKLDETVTYGGILNVALRAKLPLTVYTDGQRVPENLGWLSPEVMAKWYEQR